MIPNKIGVFGIVSKDFEESGNRADESRPFDYSIIEKSPGYKRRLAVAQPPVKDHQLLITAPIYTIRTNYVKEKIDKT